LYALVARIEHAATTAAVAVPTAPSNADAAVTAMQQFKKYFTQHFDHAQASSFIGAHSAWYLLSTWDSGKSGLGMCAYRHTGPSVRGGGIAVVCC
jgi:hypothetical protein